MARRRTEKTKKRKAVLVTLLERKHSGKTTEAYRILDDLIDKHHTHLREAKIAIAWRHGWKCDADGRLILGRCKKGSDLDRALHGFDFVILLNHEAWNTSTLDEKQRIAVIDHELCHAAVSMDSNGEPKQDDKGRQVYRIRKHDLEEFREVIARHGLYKSDVAEFAKTAMEVQDRPLLKVAQ